MTLELCQFYFMGHTNRVRISVYYLYNHVELGKLGGVILPALCIGIIMHPSNISSTHCSSQYYSLKY